MIIFQAEKVIGIMHVPCSIYIFSLHLQQTFILHCTAFYYCLQNSILRYLMQNIFKTDKYCM